MNEFTSYTRLAAAVAALALAAGGACAQTGGPFNLTWSTVDGGGSTAGSTGGAFNVAGTAGQPDAGHQMGGAFVVDGGFWSVTLTGGSCYANCDNSTTPPILNVNDFICFQAAFAGGLPYANCDGSTTIPVLNVNDFICFQAAFAAGCP